MIILFQVLSVAVYNHYKRIYNNTPQTNNSRQDMAVMEQGPQTISHRGWYLFFFVKVEIFMIICVFW